MRYPFCRRNIKKGAVVHNINEKTDVWAKYETIGYKQKNRVMYGCPVFSVNERAYFRLFKTLKEQNNGIFSSCLDVGCGGGNNTDILLGLNVTKNVVGVDQSEGALRGAKDALAEYIQHGRVELVLNEFTDLQLDRQFDLVVAIQVINYFHELDFFFETITKFIRDGGSLIIVDVQKDESSLALLEDRLKRNPFIRNVFNKKRFEENSSLIFHNPKDIRAHALNYNLTLSQGYFGGHFIWKIFRTIMYRISTKEFKTTLMRNMSKIIFIILRGLIEIEDALLSSSSRGLIHFSIFSKNSVGASQFVPGTIDS